MNRSTLKVLWIIITFFIMSFTANLFESNQSNARAVGGFWIILEIAFSVWLFKRVAGPRTNFNIRFGKKIPTAFDEYSSQNNRSINDYKAPSVSYETYEQYRGRLGEDEIASALLKITAPNRILRNLLLSTEDQSHEIDMICITEIGIYIIESKNYKGWIYGNAENKNWTQTFQNQTKNQFYNPILQNTGHIKHLEKLVRKYGEVDLFSVIVFSDNAILKSVPRSNNTVMVINTGELADIMNASIIYNRKLARGPIFAMNQIEMIWSDLYQYSVKTQSELDQHIQKAKSFQ